MTLDELKMAHREMVISGRQVVAAFARIHAPNVNDFDLAAILRAVGEISITEAFDALKRLQGEHESTLES